ncbi:MAG: hypothetical protein AMJ95_00965 [Omnitrophica WOR_2 bacterium SM23_72]|nr:MAG: hypothetical protein AMJ95_00965 [Omnitrophica WOR_2 bacterium SM23_72]
MTMVIFILLVIGLSGLVAQVLLLRELLVSFYGNELTVGVILANWIVAEALGVFIFGKIVDRIKNTIPVFILLQLLFSLSLPLAVYLSRTYKILMGIPFGQALGLGPIFYASFLIILPVGFCHGALFSAICKIHSVFTKETAPAIGKVYAWETFGTLLGGICMTYLFVPYLNSFQIVLIVGFLNLFICLFFLNSLDKIFRYVSLLAIIFIALLYLVVGPSGMQRRSISRQWQSQQILDYRNSVYGNIAVTRQQEQYTFFYNGIPIITAPYPDQQFVEDFGHLPLLFHPSPRRVLIVSAGAGGLIHEMLKHPVQKIDYIEIDPLLFEMLKKFPTPLTESELSDKRVNIIHLDGRFFLRTQAPSYDLILIGISNPSDLSKNRLFTQEFFFLVKERLEPEGILAFWLPGSLAYLSRELKNINASIINGAREVFTYLRIIPGDYNIFLASQSEDIMDITAALISRKISGMNLDTNLLVPDYLEYRLSSRWLNWFQAQLLDSTKEVNEDLRPIAVFETLTLWNEKFSPWLAGLLKYLKGINLFWMALFALAVSLLILPVFKRFPKEKILMTYSIATTGFFGMLATLILILSFQVFYGYLYQWIALLMSVFMAGAAWGSMVMVKKMRTNDCLSSLFMKCDFLILIFCAGMGLAILKAPLVLKDVSPMFVILFLLAGFLVGLEFPLASKIYLGKGQEVGSTLGMLSSADLLGGWLAGMLGGIVLIPVLGVWNTCLALLILKSTSLLWLTVFRKSLTKGAV